MHIVLLICLLSLFLPSFSAEANYKKETVHPRFVTANTSRIEIKKVVLTAAHTQVDAIIYGTPGEPVGLSMNTYLRTPLQIYSLREADVPIGSATAEPKRIPSSGKLKVTLSFEPLPEDVHTVDFVEGDSNWTIWGLQLSGTEPYVFLPSFLHDEGFSQENTAIPSPEITAGKGIVNGYLLGYDTSMAVELSLSYNDHLFPELWKKRIEVRDDGSFHVETDMLCPDTVRLQVNQASQLLFLVPGKELTVYLHLPRLSMSACPGLRPMYAKQRKIWFDGAADAINNELAGEGTPSEAWETYCAAARKLYQSVSFKDKAIHDYVELRKQTLAGESALHGSKSAPVVEQLDASVTGDAVWKELIAPYKGHAVLLDFWATWCAPCRKSMVAMRPLKQRLAAEDIVYLYVTGPSSPEMTWKENLKKLPGVHYRLTETQWNDLCRSCGVSRIPGYIVLDRNGQVVDKYTGFPGVDVLQKSLRKALDR